MELTLWLLRSTPTRLGVFLRRIAYRPFMRQSHMFDIENDVEIKGLRNLHIGTGTCIEQRCTLLCTNSSVEIEDNCYMNKNVRIGADGGGEVRIGNHVMIGPNTVIDPSTHKTSDLSVPMRNQGMEFGRIIIEEDVWIGANVVIVKDVTVGKGAIIAAGAIVTSDVKSYSLVGGVPAKLIRNR